MKSSVFYIMFLLIAGCASKKQAIVIDALVTNTVQNDTLFESDLKVSAGDSITIPFYLIKHKDSILFICQLDSSQFIRYGFRENIKLPRAIFFSQYDGVNGDQVSFLTENIFENKYADEGFVFEKLNDSLLYVENSLNDIESRPYQLIDPYEGFYIGDDSTDQNGELVYAPFRAGHAENGVYNMRSHHWLLKADFDAFYTWNGNYLLQYGYQYSVSSFELYDAQFNLVKDSMDFMDVLNNEIGLSILLRSNELAELADPAQKMAEYITHYPIILEKDGKKSIYELKSGKRKSPYSEFVLYNPGDCKGLYLKKDSLMFISTKLDYINGRGVNMRELDSISDRPRNGTFYWKHKENETDNPMRYQWINEHQAVFQTRPNYTHYHLKVCPLGNNIIYCNNRTPEVREPLITVGYGEDSVDVYGNYVYSGVNYAGVFKCGVYDLNKKKWLIPEQYIWIMDHNDLYLARGPITDENGIYIGDYFDIYDKTFTKLKSNLTYKELPDDFQTVLEQ